MGQIEIFELLKNRRLTGDHSFFKARDIKKMLRDAGKPYGSGTYLQIAQLESFGYLEVKREKMKRSGEHWRLFRLKSEYADTKKEADIQKEPLILLDKTGESQVADLPKEAF